MPFNFSQKTFLELEKTVVNNSIPVIPYIGAGLSIYGETEERLPGWKNLSEKILNQVSEEIELDDSFLVQCNEARANNDFSLIIELLYKKGCVQIAQDIIKHELNVKGKEPPPALINLLGIKWKIIVTTNLDRFIEEAWFRLYGTQIDVITWQDDINFQHAAAHKNPLPALLKVHGTIEKERSWVFTKEQYRSKILENPKIQNVIKNLYLNNTFLFIGYGLVDDDFQPIVEEISNLFDGQVGRNYAILPSFLKANNDVTKVRIKYNIRTVFFDIDNSKLNEKDGGFGDLNECLERLNTSWRIHHLPIQISIRNFPDLDPNFLGRSSELEEISRKVLNADSNGVQIIGFGGEGKTSLILKWIKETTNELTKLRYTDLIAFSVNEGNLEDLIDHLYNQLLVSTNRNTITPLEKVNAIKLFLEQHKCSQTCSKKIILILDGIELFLNDNGEIVFEPIAEIIHTAITNNHKIILTSRIEADIPVDKMVLEELSRKDAINYVKIWFPNETNTTIERFLEDVGHHILSLRLLLPFLSEKNIDIKFVQFESIKITKDIKDSFSLRGTNKAERVLSFYDSYISENIKKIISVFSLLRNPIEYEDLKLLLDFISIRLAGENDGNINWKSSLNLSDLKYMLDLRLVSENDSQELLAHPLIKEHYIQSFSRLEFERINFHLGDLFETSANKGDTKEERLSLYGEACFHFGRSKALDKFHQLFYKDLNKEKRYEYANVLSSWNDFLSIVSTLYPEEKFSNQVTYKPELYESCVALAFRRLGNKVKALQHYYRSIKAHHNINQIPCLELNNFFHVLMISGRLKDALKIIPYNCAAIERLNDLSIRDKQKEHCYHSFVNLFLKLDMAPTALMFFEAAEKARKSEDYNADSYHNLTRIAAIEVLLHDENKDLNRYNDLLDEIINLSIEKKWGDMETSCYIRKAKGLASYSKDSKDQQKHLIEAINFLDKALKIALMRSNNELEVEIRIERMHIENCLSKFSTQELQINDYNASRTLSLITRKSQYILLPILYLAQANRAFLKKDKRLDSLIIECFQSAQNNNDIETLCNLKIFLKDSALRIPGIDFTANKSTFSKINLDISNTNYDKNLLEKVLLNSIQSFESDHGVYT